MNDEYDEWFRYDMPELREDEYVVTRKLMYPNEQNMAQGIPKPVDLERTLNLETLKTQATRQINFVLWPFFLTMLEIICKFAEKKGEIYHGKQ